MWLIIVLGIAGFVVFKFYKYAFTHPTKLIADQIKNVMKESEFSDFFEYKRKERAQFSKDKVSNYITDEDIFFLFTKKLGIDENFLTRVQSRYGLENLEFCEMICEQKLILLYGLENYDISEEMKQSILAEWVNIEKDLFIRHDIGAWDKQEICVRTRQGIFDNLRLRGRCRDIEDDEDNADIDCDENL